MLGIGKRIEKLGKELTEAFNARAVHWFTKAATEEGQTKANMNLLAAVLSEVGGVIAAVTKESKDGE